MSANTARIYLYCKTEQNSPHRNCHRQHLNNESLINRRISKNSLYNDLDLFPLQLKQGNTPNHSFRFHLSNITTKSQYYTFHQLFIAHKSYISKPSGTIYRKNITSKKQASSFYDIEKYRLAKENRKKMIYHSKYLYTYDQNRNLTHERKHHARNIFTFLSHGLPTRSRWIRSSSNRKSTFTSHTLLPPRSRTRLKSTEVFGKSPRLLRKSPLLFVLPSRFFSEQKRRHKKTSLTLTKKTRVTHRNE